MLSKSEQLYKDCKLYCRTLNTSDDTYKLAAIYSKSGNIKAVAPNEDSSQFIIFDPYKAYEFVVIEALFNFDEFDFELLENGYQIYFMSIEHHYNFWESISDVGIESFENKIGIQKYMQFCKQNNINKETITNEIGLNVSADILRYYKKTSLDKVSRNKDDRKKEVGKLDNKGISKNHKKKGLER